MVSNCGADYARTTRAREARRPNRLELWRYTHSRNARKSNILDHLEAWEDLKEEFGQELSNAPGQRLVMFKKTLPTSITNELIDRPPVRTYEEVLAFCRRRTDYRKEQDLYEFAKKKILTKTRLNSLTTEPIDQPSHEASAGPERRRGRDREAAVALANTPGFVDEFITAMLNKKGGKGDGKGSGRGRSPGAKGRRQRKQIEGQLTAAEEQVHMEWELLLLQRAWSQEGHVREV